MLLPQTLVDRLDDPGLESLRIVVAAVAVVVVVAAAAVVAVVVVVVVVFVVVVALVVIVVWFAIACLCCIAVGPLPSQHMCFDGSRTCMQCCHVISTTCECSHTYALRRLIWRTCICYHAAHVFVCIEPLLTIPITSIACP